MIDLSNPDHEATLHDAVERMRKNRWSKVPQYLRGMAAAAKAPPLKLAYQAFLDPKKAADLIRQLVVRAGVVSGRYAQPLGTVTPWTMVTVLHKGTIYITWNNLDERGCDGRVASIAQCPAYITRLLALAPGAGPQAVLDALRGDSRLTSRPRATTTTKGLK